MLIGKATRLDLPLDQAVRFDRVEYVRLLLDAGADPGARTDGITPLEVAIYPLPPAPPRPVTGGFPVFCCRGGPLRAWLLPERFSRCCPQPGCRSGDDQGPPDGDPGPAPLHGPGHPGDIEHGVLGFAGDREHRQPPVDASLYWGVPAALNKGAARAR